MSNPSTSRSRKAANQLCTNIAQNNRNVRRCGTAATEETPPRRKVRAMFFTQASAKAAAERRAQRTTLHLSPGAAERRATQAEASA